MSSHLLSTATTKHSLVSRVQRRGDVSGASPKQGTNTGIALLRLGRYAESVEAFDRSLTLSPGQSNAMAIREEA